MNSIQKKIAELTAKIISLESERDALSTKLEQKFDDKTLKTAEKVFEPGELTLDVVLKIGPTTVYMGDITVYASYSKSLDKFYVEDFRYKISIDWDYIEDVPKIEKFLENKTNALLKFKETFIKKYDENSFEILLSKFGF